MSNVVALPQESPEQIPTFDDFWLLWPAERRLCKKQAREQWARLSVTQHVEALTALVGWRRVWQARGEWEYVVHPHRWLRDWRWEDELPQGYSGNGSQAYCVAPSEPVKRGTMPDHVKALLAKLRGKG